jgi:hypothetical protein
MDSKRLGIAFEATDGLADSNTFGSSCVMGLLRHGETLTAARELAR